MAYFNLFADSISLLTTCQWPLSDFAMCSIDQSG